MISSRWVRRVLAAVIVGMVAVPVAAQLPQQTFKNLKVLPKDTTQEGIDSVMAGFTRALGVRCAYCHVGEEGKPMRREDFPQDDKPTKRKARAMMQMTQDLNDKYLAQLETHVSPPIKVQCFTCHHGVSQPRTLQDVLTTAYDTGGVDSTLSRYRALRDRFYGRAAYDFGEVPLADVGAKLRQNGHGADNLRLQALNVEMNPNSAFAKRRFANAAIGDAFRTQSVQAATDTLRSYQQRYGAAIVSEDMVNDVAYQLVAEKRLDTAIALFKLNVADHPESGNVYDSLGEAYAMRGDRNLAIESYTKAVAHDSTNVHAKQQINELKASSKKKKKS
jgi:predicted Zn-dependent protease